MDYTSSKLSDQGTEADGTADAAAGGGHIGSGCAHGHSGQRITIGAKVWDQAHGKHRGWGEVVDGPRLSDKGETQYQIKWEHGERKRWLGTPYFELTFVPACCVVPPTAINQAVTVLLGKYKGDQGMIVGKVRGCMGLVHAGCQRFVASAQPPTPHPIPPSPDCRAAPCGR